MDMTAKNKGGRLPVDKQFILETRAKLFRQLVARKWTNADIGILFNIHPSAISRVLKK